MSSNTFLMYFRKYNTLFIILESTMETYLTIREAAALVRVAPQTIRNLISSKQLRSAKFFGRRLVPHSALEELVKTDAEKIRDSDVHDYKR